MPLVRTNGASAIVARARVWEKQRPWPARYAAYGSLAHSERKILKWKGLAMVRGVCGDKDHLVSGRYCVAAVMTLSPGNGDPWFWSWRGNDEQEPIWGCVLSHIWSTFWCVELVRARRNGGEISHFRCAETASFHRPNCVQIDVARIFPKPFHEYATIKPEVKWVLYVTRVYATAGISRYRFINVAPNRLWSVVVSLLGPRLLVLWNTCGVQVCKRTSNKRKGEGSGCQEKLPTYTCLHYLLTRMFERTYLFLFLLDLGTADNCCYDVTTSLLFGPWRRHMYISM